MPAIPESDHKAKGAEELYQLMPLQFFYARENRSLPRFRFIGGEEMPEVERSLLVHDTDMTPTLTKHHGEELQLRVLEKEESEDYLMRLVDLVTVESGKVVEFGAIGIRLEGFSERVRGMIRECVKPLGAILGEEGVPHRGQPSGYFEVEADELISEALGARVGERLYGRCNQLIDNEGIVLADIVEILPGKGEAGASRGA